MQQDTITISIITIYILELESTYSVFFQGFFTTGNSGKNSIFKFKIEFSAIQTDLTLYECLSCASKTNLHVHYFRYIYIRISLYISSQSPTKFMMENIISLLLKIQK